MQGVVAQEVGGLAHFGERVRDGAAGFTNKNGHQLGAVALDQIGGGIEDFGACGAAQAIPVERGVRSRRERRVYLGFGGVADGADALAAIVRAQDEVGHAACGLNRAGDDGCCLEGLAQRGGHFGVQRRPHGGIVERQAGGIAPFRPENVARLDERFFGFGAAGTLALGLLDGIANDPGDWHLIVGEAVDK